MFFLRFITWTYFSTENSGTVFHFFFGPKSKLFSIPAETLPFSSFYFWPHILHFLKCIQSYHKSSMDSIFGTHYDISCLCIWCFCLCFSALKTLTKVHLHWVATSDSPCMPGLNSPPLCSHRTLIILFRKFVNFWFMYTFLSSGM